jgi:hypothetical protein
MKTHLTLRSTLSNTSWTQRGAVAQLLVAALMVALTLALRPAIHVPAPAPAVRQAAPTARNPNMPVIGTGSAYDGSAYVEYLLSSPIAPSSNVPISGTRSAYDGMPYRAASTKATHMVHHSPIQTASSSAYDGQTGRSFRPVIVTTRQMPMQTAASSAYDGQAYQTRHRVAIVAGPSNPIQFATSSAYTGETTAAIDPAVQGVNDYLRVPASVSHMMAATNIDRLSTQYVSPKLPVIGTSSAYDGQ